MEYLYLPERDEEQHSEVVTEHIKRALFQHVVDAVSAHHEVCGFDETINTMNVVKSLIEE